MSSFKAYGVQVIGCFLIALLCLWGATAWTASELGFHSGLGTPWITLFGLPLYAPWSLFVWWLRFEDQAPDIFACAGGLAALGGALSASIAIGARVWRGRAGKNPDTYGSARWASQYDVRQASLFGDKGVILGCLGNRYLRHDGPEHILAVAPTRSGKGVSLVIPTLLTWPGSAVIHDLKGENWALTAGWRSKFSDCLLFDPVSPQSVHFNPLLEVRRGRDEVRDVQNIADILVDPEGARERRDHWEKTAHALLVGAILHVLYAEEEKTLARVAHFLTDPARSIRRTLWAMLTTNHIGSEDAPRAHPVIASVARELLNKSENERSGVVSTAMSFLGLYRDPIIAANTAQSDFKIADLTGGSRPISLYLAVPPSDLSRTRPLIRMLLNQIGRRLTERHEQDRGQDVGAKLLLMLDEFPALGRLDFFETALAFLAGYGIRAFLVAQSLNQIDKAYGQNNAILDNCHVRVAFAPNDERTAKRLSDALGTATQERHQRNLSGRRFSAWLSHTTISHQETARPLLTPGEILQLPQNESLILLSGIPPIRARKLYYYLDRNFVERRLSPPALGAHRNLCREAHRDWTGFIRKPHPGLERESSEIVTANGPVDDDGGREPPFATIVPSLNREEAATRFDEQATPASKETEDDSATIELPGGVRLS